MGFGTISHYELDDILGQGGMGRVYRARDVVLERPVAIKVIAANTAADPEFLDRFRREAKLAAQLNHPNIATIYEFGQDGERAFIAMELVDGMTLRQLLANGPLSVEQVRKCGEQAAAALAVAHGRGIVHRDIKAENLMLTRDGRLKIMDFGIARRTGDTQLTAAGQVIGTPNTMAPETIQGHAPGPAADLFALGCVLYEALAGRPPFQADQAMAVLYRIAHDEPVHVTALRPETPADLAAIVHGLLRKDPEARLGPAASVSQSLSLSGLRALPHAGTVPLSAAPDVTVTIEPTPAPTTAPARAPATAPAPALVGIGAPGLTLRTRLAKRANVRRVFVFGGFAVAGLLGIWLVDRRTSGDARGRATALNDAGFRVMADSADVARQRFETASRLDPTFVAPWINLGALSRQQGELQQAEQHLRQALQLDSTRTDARINLAETLADMGRVEAALAEYARVGERDREHAIIAANNAGNLMVLNHEGERAVQLLDAAVARWDSVAPLWKNLALARLATQDSAAAVDAFRRAVELDPTNVEALAGLAELAEARGDREQAAALRARALDLGHDPDAIQRGSVTPQPPAAPNTP